MDRWANPFVDMSGDYPHVFEHQKRMTSEPAVRFAMALERNANTPLDDTACTPHQVFAGAATRNASAEDSSAGVA